MATLPELENALRKAHAAGNTEHARAFAAEIRRMRSQAAGAPDFSNVQAGSRSSEAYAPTDRAVRAERDAGPDPTADMGALERGAAGFGRSYVNAVRGAGQLMAESNASNLAAADSVLRAAGLDSVADALARTVGIDAAQRKREADRSVQQAAELDAPLMATTGGKVGDFAGTLSQLVGPGMLARGTAAAPALLPTTVRGAALQGGTLGAVQPVHQGESRVGNIARGAAVGGAGAGALSLAGKAASAARHAFRTPEERAAIEAVRLIQSEVGDSGLARLAQSNPSAVPGATRTLFEESQLPGVARLETLSRGAQATNWTARDLAENEARLRALRGFAGDEADLAAAELRRSNATADLRDAAMAEGEQTARLGAEAGFSAEANRLALRSQLQALAEQHGGRDTVQKAIQAVIYDLDNAQPSIRGLYNVRKSINDMIEGKAGSERAGARAAVAELLDARRMVDDEIAQLAPSFGNYLGEFQRMSGPVNRMQVGQELIRRGTNATEDLAGNYTLQPGQFGRAVKNIDELATGATGFARADGAQILGPEAMQQVAAVADDLARQSRRATYGSGGNSHTQSQQALAGRMGQATDRVLRMVPYLGDALVGGREFLKARNAERLSVALETVLRQPEEYRRIAAKLSPADRTLLDSAISQSLVQSGTALAQ